MKIIVAAGGTGGHIIPALAITEELMNLGCEILYVGNINSMEERLAKAKDIPFSPIDVQKLYRNFTFSHIKFPFKLIQSVLRSIQIIHKFKPDAFVGTGGFVSGPVGFAASLTKTPIFLQEQNSYPGLTTRLLAGYAKRIFVANKGALKYLPKEKCQIVGNPVHPSISSETDKIDYQQYQLNQGNQSILILGGSQGSTAINNAILDILDQLLEKNINVLWQCGKRDYESLTLKLKGKKGLYLFAFSNEMGKLCNSADIAVARSGAMTLAELEIKEIPSILIPLPTAAENHQVFNAYEQEEKKIAKVIEQKKLNPEILLSSILDMLANIDEYKSHFSPDKGLKSALIIARQIVEDLES
jgi:UDP-N-acetylglucosamine--N-acetylmuramyl-(pentapeptide) pyrophosphoryl-undecaprenol N-acetylglucosamine transferase